MLHANIQEFCTLTDSARLLGNAAYASDRLAEVSKSARVDDFVEIARVCPEVRPFEEAELLVITSYDPHSPLLG